MQSATVVYLTHPATLPSNTDMGDALRRAGLDPLWTELAAGSPGFDSIPEALLRLARRGAHRVEAVWGRWESPQCLHLAGTRQRVMG